MKEIATNKQLEDCDELLPQPLPNRLFDSRGASRKASALLLTFGGGESIMALALELYFRVGVSSRLPVSPPPPNPNPPAPAPGSLVLSSKGWNSAVCIAELMCT